MYRPNPLAMNPTRFLNRKWIVQAALPVLAFLPLTQATIQTANAEADKPENLISKTPLQSPQSDSGYDGPLFEMLPPDYTGVTHVNTIDITHPLKRAYHSSSACGGANIGDVDLDGVPDLFVTSGPGPNHLYLQKGDFQFQDVTSALGLDGGESWSVGSALVDIDNDGDLDIYVCNYDSPNLLFINQSAETGKLSFTEKAEAFGLAFKDACVMPAFCDYDLDGDLDVYILHHQLYREHGRPAEAIPVVMEDGREQLSKKWRKWFNITEYDEKGEPMYSEIGRPDRLMRNNGDGTFSEVTEEAGIHTDPRFGNSATWWDYDVDGDPDLYVGNDFHDPDYFYRNEGDGTFTEIGGETLPHTTWFTMGAAAADFNNDLLPDFMLADMFPTTHYMQKASMGGMGSGLDQILAAPGARQLMRNALYVNTGTPRFMESALLSHVAKTDWTWAIKGEDFDNDGRNDLFFTNGIPRQFNHSDLPGLNHQKLIGKTHWDWYENTPERREQNLAFRNDGDLHFHDVSEEWGLAHMTMSYGATVGDLDADGDLDLIVSNLQDPTSIYRNQSREGGRLILAFKGANSNLHGWGVTAIIETPDGGRQIRQNLPSSGFLDCDEAVIHFGLGDQKKVSKLTVLWPSGHLQTFQDLEAGFRYTIQEPTGPGPKEMPSIGPKMPEPLFTESDLLKETGKVEAPFDDFARQSLLPHAFSQLGPGQAWGDVDGDGDYDLYLGGSTRLPGMLYLRNGTPEEPKFELSSQDVFLADAEHEDLGALFFDADSDGDQDLYVVSGSVEAEPGDPVFQDRLYLNQGGGNFERASGAALPKFTDSGAAISAADFDRDGDLDLFAGSRIVPGQYPLVPVSHFLRNDGGQFTDATAEVCAGLSKTGLVTSSLWTDVDQDGWIDLLVAHDWGPVKVFRNAGNGTLEDMTEAAGLADVLGWWNGLAARDLDGDGDMDFVATNFGTNTIYHASLQAPELIFFNDFDNSGKAHIVEAHFDHDTCYPRRGLSCSSRAMPYIKDKIQTYHNYGLSTLTNIYDVGLLEKALRHKVNNTHTSVFLNDGEGRFTVRDLPTLAQFSPGYGVVITDVNVDGHADIYLVHNTFSPQVETGPMDCGLSALLLGKGDGTFRALWPAESGLIVPGDAKSLAVTDLNGDSLPDFAIGNNNEDPQVFLNRAPNAKGRPLRLALKDKPGNPTAVGARVTVSCAGLPDQTAEIQAGGSFLTQSPPDVIFAVPAKVSGKEAETAPVKITIRWPDGDETETELVKNEGYVTIQR